MPYSLMVIGDANVARFWEAAQVARPQLVGVSFRPVSCMDTISASLREVNDGLDYVLLSVLTSLLLEECSAANVAGTSKNIIGDLSRHLIQTAKRSSKVEVCIYLIKFVASFRQ